MKLGKATVLSVAVVTALGVGTGTAHASTPAQSDPGVGYTTSILPDGRSVATVLDSGLFRPTADGTAVDILDAAGTAISRLPLAYGLGGAEVPVSATVDQGGRELILTPQAPPIDVRPAYSEAAYQNMIDQVQKGWLNGGQLQANTGAAIGLVVGCVLFLFVGCPLGAAIGGTIGAVTGVVDANPAAQPAVFEFLATLP